MGLKLIFSHDVIYKYCLDIFQEVYVCLYLRSSCLTAKQIKTTQVTICEQLQYHTVKKKNQRVFYFSIGELGESSKAVITYNKRVGQN